ncbi:MAG TPA: Gfo/Idh/MocA family oxidoreductase, partial [Chloroflexota bacterium]
MAQSQTSQKTLNVAIAGLGVASNQILPAMVGTPGVQLVAAADLRQQARDAFQTQYGAPAYEDIEELCRDPNVDAIWISTPNQYHCPHAILAAEHGKHIVIEKPMALNMDEAEKMVEAVERNDVQMLCGHTQSFNPDVQQIARMIASGELGHLAAINIWSFTDWMLRARMPQEVDPSLGGGVVYRQGPHQVDTARLLGGGMVRSVRARAGEWMPERQCPGYYSAYLEFESGIPALITHNGYGYFVISEFFFPDHPGPANRHQARLQLRQGQRDEAQLKEQS